MEDINKPTIVADDVVVSLQYTLTINGETVDDADENDPLVFLQGYRNIIPGLEKELYGMKIGDTKTVSVKPQDGYGEIDPEAMMDVPRNEFPEDIPMEVGVELEVRDEDGEVMSAVITDVNDNTIRLDFNHPLAGEQLEFNVKVLDLRVPTAEELEHGHVHSDEEDEDYDEEFDEEFDDELVEFIDEEEDEEDENDHHH